MTTPSKRRRLKLKKGGRPRKDGMRTKSGRLSRSKEAKDYISAKEAEENRSVVLDARARHNGKYFNKKDKKGNVVVKFKPLPLDQANNPLLGSEVGRLYNLHLLSKKKKVQDWRSLTEKEYDATQRFIEDISRYHGLSGVPFPNARSANLFAVGGYEGEETQSRQEATKRATNRFMALQGLLLSNTQGRRILEAVYNVCILDHSTENWSTVQFGQFRHGVKALVKYYGGER